MNHAARLTQVFLGWATIVAGAGSLGTQCNPGGGGGAGGSAGNGMDGGAGIAGAAGSAGAGGAPVGGTGGRAGAAGSPTAGSGGAAAGGAAGTAAGGAAGAGATGGLGGVGGVPDECVGVTDVICGDGCRVSAEECDDGNLLDDDACSANCVVQDMLSEPPAPATTEPVTASRTQGLGPHPIAASDSGLTNVFLNLDTQPPTLSAKRFSASGVRSATELVVGMGSTATLMANPVVADLGGGRAVVAWADFDHDGDELGVALQHLDFQTGSASPVTFANVTRDFSQLDPDIIRTDSGFVVAWMDEANPSTAPDLRFRRFTADGTAIDSTDQTLAATDSNEADVALTALPGGFAAVWRAASGGSEVIHVRTVPGEETWSVPVLRPGPLEDRLSIAAATDGSLIVAFSEGTQPAGAPAGDDDVPVLRVARLIPGEPSEVYDVSPHLEPYRSDPLLGQFRPSLTVLNGNAYVAWVTERLVGNARSEEAWLKRIPLGGLGLDLSNPEIALPRFSAHQADDQRRPALAGFAYPAGGYALFASWDDYGRAISARQSIPDVALQVIPLPVLRQNIVGGD